ncbi:hypothetical protein [Sulfurirhabdus autotrophica]|uniref:PilZ domain-containing protein n=1 Tax=Sulfurirhabdus autotrophica TaxID=1706046 RepID=A0A4V2W1S7_9PROT|nr:hypothetical protein [Sulfurirhabdus autotrophica]TCV85339.1 hypothetical protein EDC63_10910 [Sulfurirhabdus autotrophica]
MFSFKKLLKKGPDHPMGNIQDAKKLLLDLPLGSSLKALEEVSFWLDSVRNTDGYNPVEQFEILKLLDETAQPLQLELSQQYLDLSRMQKTQENRLWMALFEFWKHLAAAYEHCISLYEGNGEDALLIEKHLPLMVIRTMRAYAEQNKLLYIRYRPIDEKIWAGLSKLYFFAESNALFHGLLVPYQHESGPTTAFKELLRAVMLSVSTPDKLLPVQIHLADKVIMNLINSFSMSGQPEVNSMFYMDISAHTAPARLIKGTPIHAVMLFFSSNEAAQNMKIFVDQIDAGVIPQSLDFASEFKKDDLQEVFHILEQCWSPTPPQRKTARSKVVTRLNVVHGFKEIRRKIAISTQGTTKRIDDDKDVLYQERVDLKLYGFVTDKTKQMRIAATALENATVKEEGNTESWVTVNISECGFGAVIPSIGEDWVKIGLLIALKPEDGKEWVVGTVRRLSRDSDHKIHVGIQVLGHNPASIRMQPSINNVSVWEKVTDVVVSTHIDAIFMGANNKCVDESTLLMEPQSFVGENCFEMINQEETCRIALNKLLEEGQDYQRISYREIAS